MSTIFQSVPFKTTKYVILQSEGRDKVCKSLLFSGALVQWFFKNFNMLPMKGAESVSMKSSIASWLNERIDSLLPALSLARRFFRFGRGIYEWPNCADKLEAKPLVAWDVWEAIAHITTSSKDCLDDLMFLSKLKWLPNQVSKIGEKIGSTIFLVATLMEMSVIVHKLLDAQEKLDTKRMERLKFKQHQRDLAETSHSSAPLETDETRLERQILDDAIFELTDKISNLWLELLKYSGDLGQAILMASRQETLYPFTFIIAGLISAIAGVVKAVWSVPRSVKMSRPIASPSPFLLQNPQPSPSPIVTATPSIFAQSSSSLVNPTASTNSL
eukprot:TRINITY_DN440_c0_g2_i1.p1 TRINITY_DN440_c0_g2~~TRINITY_DN440_c0_g2_i1.p1  ORF type:complete len:329 (-),score=74.63 TRINITY_DN440_c0_g2_i1:232-1218(-)